MVLTIVTISDPTSAGQKPVTVKPSINDAANRNKEALITKINKPTVRTVIGKVRISRIGRTKRFSRPIITAAMRAVYSPSILIPGT